MNNNKDFNKNKKLNAKKLKHYSHEHKNMENKNNIKKVGKSKSI